MNKIAQAFDRLNEATKGATEAMQNFTAAYAVEDGHKMPKARRKAGSEPPAVKTAFNEYADAYKAVYGVRPLSYTYDVTTKFIRIENSGGVSLSRLREMTKQLRYRKG